MTVLLAVKSTQVTIEGDQGDQGYRGATDLSKSTPTYYPSMSSKQPSLGVQRRERNMLNPSRRPRPSNSASQQSREWDKRWNESMRTCDEDSSVEHMQPAPRILNKIPLKPPTQLPQPTSHLPLEAKVIHRTMTSSTEEDDDTLGSNYSTDYMNSLAEFRSRVLASHTDTRVGGTQNNASTIPVGMAALTSTYSPMATSSSISRSPFTNNLNPYSKDMSPTNTTTGTTMRSLHGRDSPIMSTSTASVSNTPQSHSTNSLSVKSVLPERLMYPSKQKKNSTSSHSSASSSTGNDNDILFGSKSTQPSLSSTNIAISRDNSREVQSDDGPTDMNLNLSAISLNVSTSEWDTQSQENHYLTSSFSRRSPLEDSTDVGVRDKYICDGDTESMGPNEVDTTHIVSNKSRQALKISTSLRDITENGYVSPGSESSDETIDEIAECVADVSHYFEESRMDNGSNTMNHDSPILRRMDVPVSTPILLLDDDKEEDLREQSMDNSTDTRTSTQSSVEDQNDGPASLLSYLHSAASKYLSQGDYSNAVSCFERVLRIHQTIHGKIHYHVASTYHNIGIVYLKQVNSIAAKLGKPSVSKEEKNSLMSELPQVRILAISAFRDAALNARDALGEDHPNIATSLIRIGSLLLDVGQHSNALATFQEALRIRKKSFGEKHPLVSKVCNNIGVAHQKLGNFQSGYEFFLYALETQMMIQRNPDCMETTASRVPTNHNSNLELDIADTVYNVGSLCLEWSKHDSYDAEELFSRTDLVDMAVSYFEEGVAIRSRLLGSMHIQTLQAQILLKRTKIELKNIDQDHDSLHDSDALSQDEYAASEMKHQSNTRSIGKTRHLSFENSRIVDDNTSMISSSSVSSVDLNSLPGKFISEQHQSGQKVMGQRRSRRSTVLEKSEITVSSTPQVLPLNRADAVQSGESKALLPNPSHLGTSQDKYSNSYDEEESCMISGNDQNDFIDNNGNISSLSSAEIAKRITVFRPKSENAVSAEPERSHERTSRKESSQTETPTVDSKRLFQSPIVVCSQLVDSVEDPESFLIDPIRYSVEVHNMAVKFLKDGDIDRSLKFFHVLLQAQRHLYGEVHQSVGLTLHNIGIVLLKAERNLEALDAFEKAVRVRKGSTGRENEHVAESLVKVGIVLLLLKRFDDALFSFREALSIRRHALGHLHPSTARIYNNIGCVHVEFNELREARRAFEYALDIQRNALCYEPDNGPLLFGAATTLCNLGYLYSVRGMYQRASAVLLEALSLQEQVLGEKNTTVLATLDNLADSFGKAGEIGQALRCYKELINRLGLDLDSSELQSRSAKDRKTHAIILVQMSALYRKQNDYEAAITKLLEASAYESSVASPNFSAHLESLKNTLEKQKERMEWL